jgi:hypothetical protein
LHRQGRLDHAFSPAELDAFRNLTFLTRPSPPNINSVTLGPH